MTTDVDHVKMGMFYNFTVARKTLAVVLDIAIGINGMTAKKSPFLATKKIVATRDEAILSLQQHATLLGSISP